MLFGWWIPLPSNACGNCTKFWGPLVSERPPSPHPHDRTVLRYSFYFIVLLVAGCLAPAAVKSNNHGNPPSFLQGEFEDDYGIKYSIDQNAWRQLPRAKYHVLKWAANDQYLIARNDEANPGEAGLWTRIDWVELSGMPPFAWGFCVSAYDAISAEAAESVDIARRDTPRTGCNGHPFSRMRRSEDR